MALIELIECVKLYKTSWIVFSVEKQAAEYPQKWLFFSGYECLYTEQDGSKFLNLGRKSAQMLFVMKNIFLAGFSPPRHSCSLNHQPEYIATPCQSESRWWPTLLIYFCSSLCSFSGHIKGTYTQQHVHHQISHQHYYLYAKRNYWSFDVNCEPCSL